MSDNSDTFNLIQYKTLNLDKIYLKKNYFTF